MFSKHVLTFLAVGTLWLNVSAAPTGDLQPNRPLGSKIFPTNNAIPAVIPGGAPVEPRELPRSFSALSYRDLTFVFSVVVRGTTVPGVVDITPEGPALLPYSPQTPALAPGPGPGPGLMSKLKSKVVKCFGEFPRSFSALSAYRDLTFVFSRVVWALIINCEETGGSEQPVNNISCIQSAEPAERWNSHLDDPDPSVGPSPGQILRNSLDDGLYLHN